MKNIMKFFSAAAVLVLMLASCEKKENQISFEGGTEPTLSSDNVSGTVLLSKPLKDEHAITFNWSNPNYYMSTGISSQNVSYAIQMREKDSAKFVTVDVVTTDLTKSYTQGQLNDILFRTKAQAGLAIPEDSIRTIEVRIVSFLGDTYYDANATNLASNVLSFIANKAYSVYPDLWITGEAVASNWTNAPPDNQKFAYDPVTKNHTISISLGGGLQYKFLTVSGQWQPQWGVNAGTVTNQLGQQFTIKENPGGGSDPDAIVAPATTGVYTITVNLENKTTVVTQ
ncbi:MAG: SusE domain-containing protein [Ferruginibacter sp.]